MLKIEKIFQKIKNDYNSIADHFSQTRQGAWQEFDDFKPYLKNGQRVLDLGCGNGRLYYSLLKDFNLEYHGIDLSERLIEIAKQSKKLVTSPVIPAKAGIYIGSQIANEDSCFRRNDNSLEQRICEFKAGDITKLPYADNSFDKVFCIATFHHLPSKKTRLKALKEMNRVLRPGGYLLMTNWYWWQKFPSKYFFNNFWQKNSYKDLFIPWRDSDGRIITKLYYYGFTGKELKGLFKKIGFKIKKNYLQDRKKPKVKKSLVNIVSVCQK